MAVSKSIINNILSHCINTRHALVKDRDSKTGSIKLQLLIVSLKLQLKHLKEHLFQRSAQKHVLETETERAHRNRKYMRTPKD